ncbi:UNVERIFIED_CONTAM: hypothetical protein GTU68_063298 [Idotea baltica]|nr:hypothetical protein [Idotea baltica]
MVAHRVVEIPASNMKKRITEILYDQEVKVTTESVKGKPPLITLESSDKQLIGQVAAKIRSYRKPEPYKGKGIKFKGEVLRRKAAQLIDDVNAVTLASANSKTVSGNKIEIATAVGKAIAEKAVSANISKCVFDRSGYLYHGRVKALAEGAREGGLNF